MKKTFTGEQWQCLGSADSCVQPNYVGLEPDNVPILKSQKKITITESKLQSMIDSAVGKAIAKYENSRPSFRTPYNFNLESLISDIHSKNERDRKASEERERRFTERAIRFHKENGYRLWCERMIQRDSLWRVMSGHGSAYDRMRLIMNDYRNDI